MLYYIHILLFEVHNVNSIKRTKASIKNSLLGTLSLITPINILWNNILSTQVWELLIQFIVLADPLFLPYAVQNGCITSGPLK